MSIISLSLPEPRISSKISLNFPNKLQNVFQKWIDLLHRDVPVAQETIFLSLLPYDSAYFCCFEYSSRK